MPKIHDQPEIDTHASSHASKASHQSHRSPPGEGSSGSSQGTTRTSLHADQAAATRKLSRNLDVSSNKDSAVRKSSKNIDPPTDADLKRGKRSVNVIAAQDRKLLGWGLASMVFSCITYFYSILWSILWASISSRILLLRSYRLSNFVVFAVNRHWEQASIRG